jgi:outer membrane protein assembly factor BamB
MNCDQARDKLELLVLGGLEPHEKTAVEAHLASCAACRAAEEDRRELVRGLRSMEPPMSPDPGFERSLRAAVRDEARGVARRRWMRRGAPGLAAAAAVVVAAVLLWRPPTEGRAEPMERWRLIGARAVPASAADEVVVHDRTAYVLRLADLGASVAAVDLDTGRKWWQSDVPSFGHLAAGEGRVYCLASIRPHAVDLVALDSVTGEEVWRRSQSGVHPLKAGAPLPLAGNRVCWVTGRTLRLLDARSGEPVWERTLAGAKAPLAVVADAGRLYVCDGSVLACVDAASGAAPWQDRLPEAARVGGRPGLALSAGRLYLTSEQGDRLVCFDLRTRRMLWRSAVEGGRHVLARGGAVYVRGRRVMAFDALTGATLWARAASGCGAMTVTDGRLCFADTTGEGQIVALDPRTGREAWRIPGVRSCDGFTLVGHTGLIKTQDGVVHALTLAQAPGGG